MGSFGIGRRRLIAIESSRSTFLRLTTRTPSEVALSRRFLAIAWRRSRLIQDTTLERLVSPWRPSDTTFVPTRDGPTPPQRELALHSMMCQSGFLPDLSAQQWLLSYA
jgi:hypothetical protein